MKLAKKFLSVLLALTMLFGYMPEIKTAGGVLSPQVTAEAAEADPTHGGTYLAWDGETALPTSGSYYLTTDVTTTAQTLVTTTLNLDVNGKTVTLGKNLIGNAGATVNITDCTATFSEDGKFVTGGTVIGTSMANSGAFYINGATFNISKIEIKDGSSTEKAAGGYGGGAFSVRSAEQVPGALNLSGCYVHDNSSATEGGVFAIPNKAKADTGYYGQEVTITCTNTIFENNKAATKGGVLFIPERAGNSATFISCDFKNNEAIANEGGAIIVNSASSSLTIDGCTFTENTGLNGSAIRMQTAPSLTVKDSFFTGNIDKATGVHSGAVYIINPDASKSVFEGSNYIKGNTNSASTPAIADLCIQNSDTLFTLKNTTDDTFINLSCANERDLNKGATLGVIEGDLNGSVIWRKSQKYCVIKEEGSLKLGQHVHDGKTYYAWLSETALPTKNPETGVGYYLAGDVTASSQKLLTADLDIDLNGHTIKKNASFWGVLVMNRATNYNLNVTSCKEGGAIIDATASTGNALIGSYGKKELAAGASGAFSMSNIKIGGVNGTANGTCVCIQGTVTANITNCEISGNFSSGSGAGLYIDTTGQVIVDNCRFIDNEAQTTGGAIRINNPASNVTIKNSTLTGNESANGAAIWAAGGSTVSIENSVITENTATMDGSAILHNNNTSAAGVLTLKNVTVTGNTCNTDAKEAVYYNTGELVLAGKNIIKDNLCNGTAGDIRLASGKTVTIGTEGLDDESEIHLYMAAAPSDGTVIANGALPDIASCFTVTNRNFTPVYISSSSQIKLYTHAHDGKIYKAWTGTTTLPTSNPSGYEGYYLTNNVTLEDRCIVSGAMNLCTNGKTITIMSGAQYEGYIGTDSASNVITIGDCTENGGQMVYGDSCAKSLFYSKTYDAVINVSNVTISGYNSTGQLINAQGGTVMRFTDCTFKDCTTSSVSALVYNSASTITFDRCKVDNCDSSYKNPSGTTKYTGFIASIGATSKTNVIDTDFTNCDGTNDSVSVAAISKGTINFTRCEFKNNKSGYQGAIWINNDATAIANIDDCLFDENEGLNASAVYVGTAGICTIKDSRIVNNITTSTGSSTGAVYVLSPDASKITIEGSCVIKNNTTKNGIPANLTLQNAETKFTLKDPEEDTVLYINNVKTRTTETIGALNGVMKGTYTWENEPKAIIASEGFLVLATPEKIVYRGKTYEPWGSKSTLPTCNPNKDNGYYLFCDTTVSDSAKLAGNLDLLLNGHEIKLTDSKKYGALRIDEGAPNKSVLNIVNNKNEGGFNGNNVDRVGCMLFSSKSSPATCELKVDNVAFYGADGATGSGHMVTVQGGINATFTDCRFHNNNVIQTGNSLYKSGSGTLTLTDCIFENNTATVPIPTEPDATLSTQAGAAVSVNDTGKAVIDGCTFTKNTSNAGASAIYFGGSNEENIVTGCKFTENKAPLGAIRISSAAAVTFINNTFSGNEVEYPDALSDKMTTYYTPANDILVIDVSTSEPSGKVIIGTNEFTANNNGYPCVSVGKRNMAIFTGEPTVTGTQNNDEYFIKGGERSAIVMDEVVLDLKNAIYTSGTLFLNDSDIKGKVYADASTNMWMIQMDAMVVASGNTKADITLTQNDESWYSKQEGGEPEKAILVVQGESLGDEAEIYINLPSGADPMGFVLGEVEIEGAGTDRYKITRGASIPGENLPVIDAGIYDITGVQLVVGKDLSLTYYTDTTDEDAYVEFEVDEEGTSAIYDEASGYVIHDGNKWTLLGISPRVLERKVTTKLYSGTGDLKYSTVPFSAADYCDSIYEQLKLKSDSYSKNVKQMVADLIRFGKESQLFTNFNIEKLPTDGRTWIEGYTLTEIVKPASDASVVSPAVSDLIKINSAALQISESTRIVFKITADTNTKITLEKKNGGSDAWTTVINAKSVEQLLTGSVDGGCTFKKSGGKYLLNTDGIMATDNDTVYRLTLESGDDIQHKVTYSVNSYVRSNWNSEKTGNIVKALHCYGLSAKAVRSAQ